MEIRFRNNKFIARSNYSEKDVLKSAGMRWDKDLRYWWTDSIPIAGKFRNYFSSEARDVFERLQEKKNEALELSKGVDADIEIPAPEGLVYLGYQKAGIAYAAGKDATLIADDMGLGKTIQAIGVMNITKPESTLIVCPASLKINWKRELEKWLTYHIPINIIDKEPDFSGVSIINYDILKKFSELQEREFDLLIADEAHYCKNLKAQRTKAIKKINAGRKIFLTGTPITNRPIELYSLINLLKPDMFNFWQYAKRYCNAKRTEFGLDLSGASNLEELQDILRSKIMVRRLKRDVLRELPAKLRQVIELPSNRLKPVVESEWEAYQRHQALLEECKIRTELAKTSDKPEEYELAVRQLKEAFTVAFNDMAKTRYETAMAKAPLVIEHIKNIIEEGQKVVVFAHHKDLIAEIARNIPDSVTLTGDHSLQERQEAVDRFQSDPSCPAFIGSMRAAGVGLTLTASSNVVFAELDWTPAVMTQAEDRTHRLGQHDSVLVQHLVLEGSLDAVMAQTIINKQNIADKALDKEYELNAEPVPVIPSHRIATEHTTRTQIDIDADKITDEQAQAIHEALRIVSSMDTDRALVRNNIGFSRIDTAIGQSLAVRENLSKRQAAFGRRLALKYSRQLPEELVNVFKDLRGREEPATQRLATVRR